ncbi:MULTISPECIES: GNAT family N-acetyltransferase [unclassified Akkermansia]|uniref:GNAT family N-acetyltransferase n=1 Tax=unclassified Akkermansia TaxID=2608915 RepID=UPI00122F925D|nr:MULTISPECIES: GNAT family N-acetyltransferase [unclassified Akkermansia]KAA3165763.1 GNAT family N-acetyltransferase [Akkermansia sp. BIOML-A60]KAA3189506.1 GNAT family N-acetyltransferase [Akkermansia sp. BIOML-A52]KAA3211299.1 GNAT family N-acetyltransferase [Akkermansia sp. BIOML-A42]KAA3214295.1 GNAT family N-acetyltransferase [Akkermansia sp. BIOML-A43]KAA3222302.1 GNAT family N-acetyltransferase [Akkermansia sp. BIOML-A41]KAA3226863.1 GNAT family N-acetyltransferase [Akkermansia sp. 
MHSLTTLPPNKSTNVRSVLEYVPYFRGKIFAVHVEQPLVNSEELVDALLDLDALQEIGVKPVLIAEGPDAYALYEHTRVCEMRSALVEAPLKGGQLVRERVREILGRHQIPVVASGRTGSFDTDSIHLAYTLGASKYIALLNDHKVPSRDGHPIAAILESEVAGLSGNLAHRELLDQAAEACRAGIPRVHLLDGKMRGVLVEELFSEEGVGTMVHTDSYREIRPLKEEDIPELLSMIARSVVDSKLVDRNYEDIAAKIDDYYVLTLDDSIVGCVAVYPYPEHRSAELGCLYIKHRHEGRGYGRTLCEFARKKAEEMGVDFIFALSQSAVHYFRDRMHYAEFSRDCLPPERLRALELSGRKSGVFGLRLK